MATLLRKAAEPEAGSVLWFEQCVEQSHNDDFTIKATIGPELAAYILAANPANRHMSERKTGEYARDMIAGRWVYNMEPIIIAKTGELNDGQHRLQAVIMSNMPQKFQISFGASRESRITVDQGMARSAGHYLAMNGVANSKLCASIATAVIAFEVSGGRTIRGEITHGEVVSRVEADEDMQISALFVNKVRKFAEGLLSPAHIGTCHYLFSKLDPQQAEEYLTEVCIGENIKRGDPAFAVRQALGNLHGSARAERIEAVFRGWVAVRQGRKLSLAKCFNSFPALI